MHPGVRLELSSLADHRSAWPPLPVWENLDTSAIWCKTGRDQPSAATCSSSS